MMKKLNQKYIDVLEANDWHVSDYTDDGRVELRTYSPAGEDFSICVEVEDFSATVDDYAATFDMDEHVEMWLQAKRTGTNGVPSARELVYDAEAIDKMLQKLAVALRLVDAREAAGIMGKEEFRKWIYDNYNVPANDSTLAPDMLDGILDYAGGLAAEERLQFFCTVFPQIPRDLLSRVDY